MELLGAKWAFKIQDEASEVYKRVCMCTGTIEERNMKCASRTHCTYWIDSESLLRGLQESPFRPPLPPAASTLPTLAMILHRPTLGHLPRFCVSFAPARLLTACPSSGTFAEQVPLDFLISASTPPIFQGQFPLCSPSQGRTPAFSVPPRALGSHHQSDGATGS